MSKHELEEE